MAKVIRQETAGVHAQSAQDWFYRESEFVEDLDISTASIRRIANETGRDLNEVHAEKLAKYWEARKEWDNVYQEARAKDNQISLVRNNSLDSTCSVFQRADRILTNLPVEVHLTDEDTDTPAWNDGKNVTFNSSAIGDLTEDNVRSLHGLNYHEVGHLFFTPRIGTALGKWVTERNEQNNLVEPLRMTAFNILEDGRAEYYLTTKYPSVRPFLVATVGEHLLAHPEALGDNFVLLAGRRYFPIEARRSSLKIYAQTNGIEKAKQVYDISSEYRTLVYPRDYTRGQELIEALISLLANQKTPRTPNGCEGRPLMRNGKPATESEQKSIVEQGEQGEQGDDLFASGAGEAVEDTNLGNEDYENSQFNEEKDVDLLNKIQEAVDHAKSDKSVSKKVFDTLRAITKDGSTKTILGKSNGVDYAPKQSEIVASRLFGQELERIRIESDPAWIIEKPTGKLNVRRAMNADVNEINKLFDRWETGNDDYDMEACILIDRSGSMYQDVGSACRSAWIIKRAIEKINGRVSVMTFGSVSRQLYSADEKAQANVIKVVEANGGTEPEYALLESQRILTQSKAKTKLLFMLTDGQFNNSVKCDKMIEAMKSDGVYTSVVYLSSWESELERIANNPAYVAELSHGADSFQVISNPADLVKVAKKVVRHQMKGNK
jgi:hypothetical protein